MHDIACTSNCLYTFDLKVSLLLFDRSAVPRSTAVLAVVLNHAIAVNLHSRSIQLHMLQRNDMFQPNEF